MRSTTSKSSFAQLLLSFAVLSVAIFAFTFSVSAQTTTFAQFSEANGTQDFVFTNNTTSGTFNTVVNGSAVDFKYFNTIANLPASIQGFQSAHLFVSTTTTLPGAANGALVSQPFQTVTIQIIRDTPAPVGVGSGSRTNLLTMTFSPNNSNPSISGTAGGNSATLSVTTSVLSPDHNLTFTSDFISFTTTVARNLALSFSSVNPSLGLGAGNFLGSFAAAASGTFASNPVPQYLIPSAAPVSFSGRLMTSDGHGLRNAQVFLTEANGTVHQATSSTFGYFNFPSIESGQSVIVSVRSKQFQFTPQVVSLNDNVADFQMTAQ